MSWPLKLKVLISDNTFQTLYASGEKKENKKLNKSKEETGRISKEERSRKIKVEKNGLKHWKKWKCKNKIMASDAELSIKAKWGTAMQIAETKEVTVFAKTQIKWVTNWPIKILGDSMVLLDAPSIIAGAPST